MHNDPQSHPWMLGPESKPGIQPAEVRMIPLCKPGPTTKYKTHLSCTEKLDGFDSALASTLPDLDCLHVNSSSAAVGRVCLQHSLQGMQFSRYFCNHRNSTSRINIKKGLSAVLSADDSSPSAIVTTETVNRVSLNIYDVNLM